MPLSESQYAEIDAFISEKPPSTKHIFKYCRMSVDQVERAKALFLDIQKADAPAYHIIPSSSFMSLNDYALYKSHTNQIYLVAVSFQAIESYVPVEDETWFDV